MKVGYPSIVIFMPLFVYFFSQGCGISGIKIHRITRVHNRILRMRFDNKLDEIMEREDINELTKYVTFTACSYAGRRRGSRPSSAGVHLKAKLSL